MGECHQRQWALKTGKFSTSAPKLCSLPHTTEAFHEKWTHLQLAPWYTTLEEVPPPRNPKEYGWEADHTNKTLSPKMRAGGVCLFPEESCKLARYGVDSEKLRKLIVHHILHICWRNLVPDPFHENGHGGGGLWQRWDRGCPLGMNIA